MHFITLTSLVTSCAAAACPPLGAVLPPPRSPSTHRLVRESAAALSDAFLRDYTARFNQSAVSIGVKSIYEDEPILDVHYTPPELSGIGTKKVNKDTIYRVASVSKIIPALLALQESRVVDWHASVLEYIPELARGEADSAIHRAFWDEVTVGSLASHLSGAASDIATDMALFPDDYWQNLGLPAIADGTGPNCSGFLGTRPCTEEDLMAVISDRPPLYRPYRGASYSNVGIILLGLVLERATGKKFDDLVKEKIFKPVGMEQSSFYGPGKSFKENGFAAIGESTLNGTFGIQEPAGGMFTTTSELLDLGSAILSYDLLSGSQTRAWLKPATNTNVMHHQVGAPWEIIRVNNITQDGRIIDLFAKSGDVGMYVAEFVLIPDYGLVVSIIAAGRESVGGVETYAALTQILNTMLPAVETAGRQQVSLQDGYTGLYADKTTNSTLRLGVDHGPGIVVEEMTMRGVDVLANIGAYSLAGYFTANQSSAPPDGGAAVPPYVDARAYPADISAHRGRQVSWRVLFSTISPEVQEELDEQLAWPGFGCQAWLGLDRQSYDYKSLGELVFSLGADRSVEGVESPVFGIALQKAGKM